MNRFRILNNRRRALVALMHSIAFGLLAFYQLMINQHPVALIAAPSGHLAGPAALTIIYLTVASVLLVLLLVSRAAIEKLYFAFCATSAAIGLMRVVLGDPTVRAGNLLRVFMLGSAVITGTFILRSHSETRPGFAD